MQEVDKAWVLNGNKSRLKHNALVQNEVQIGKGAN